MAQKYSVVEGPGLLDLLMHLGQSDPRYRKPLVFQLLEEHGDGYLKKRSFMTDGLCRVGDTIHDSNEFIIRGRIIEPKKGGIFHFSGQYNVTSRSGYIEED